MLGFAALAQVALAEIPFLPSSSAPAAFNTAALVGIIEIPQVSGIVGNVEPAGFRAAYVSLIASS